MDDAKKREVLDMIRGDEALENYFFRDVKDPDWLPLLDAAGYLDPSRFRPASSPDPCEEWNILPFVARVAEQMKDNSRAERFASRITQLYKETADAYAGNWRNAYWLVRILVALPPRYVSLEMIRTLRQWLGDHRTLDMISPEVCSELFPVLAAEADEEDKKAEELLDIVLTVEELQSPSDVTFWSETHRFVFDEYWIKTGIKKSVPHIAARFSEQSREKLVYGS